MSNVDDDVNGLLLIGSGFFTLSLHGEVLYSSPSCSGASACSPFSLFDLTIYDLETGRPISMPKHRGLAAKAKSVPPALQSKFGPLWNMPAQR